MKTTTEIALVTDTCCVCGIVFGLPEHYFNKLKESGQTFYCPNGHSLWFGKSKAEKLEAELSQIKRDANLYQQWYNAEQDDHERTRRQLSATKGQLTKTKKRIADGICPCCHRTFQNLARHMAGKHPEFAGEDLTNESN